MHLYFVQTCWPVCDTSLHPSELCTCILYKPVDLCATPRCTLQGYVPVFCTNLLTGVWHLAVPFRVMHLYFVQTCWPVCDTSLYPSGLCTCTLYPSNLYFDRCVTPSCTLQGYLYVPVLCTNLLIGVWHLAAPFRVMYLYFVQTCWPVCDTHTLQHPSPSPPPPLPLSLPTENVARSYRVSA